MCQFLQYGGPYTGLCAPRGFLKTSIGTNAYSVWRAIRNPNERIAIITNIQENAEDKLDEIRQKIRSSQLFQSLFPELLPRSFSRWSKQRITFERDCSTAEGTIEAKGIGKQITGRHYTIAIEDDTVGPRTDSLAADEYIPSQEELDKAIGFHKSLFPIQRSPETDEIHIRGTRWAEGDLIGYLRDESKRYVWYYFSVWDENQKPYYPERFNIETITKLREETSDWFFRSQYENNPLPLSMCPFSSNIHFYDTLPAKLNFFIGVDPALSLDRRADYTVIATLGVDMEGNRFSVEYDRGKYGVSETIERIFAMVLKYKGMGYLGGVAIESVQYQEALAQLTLEKQAETNISFAVYPVTPVTNIRKELRLQGIAPYFQQKRWFIGRHQNHHHAELRSFPRGRNDDTLDAYYYANRMAEQFTETVVTKKQSPWVENDDGRVIGIRVDEMEKEMQETTTRVIYPAFDAEFTE